MLWRYFFITNKCTHSKEYQKLKHGVNTKKDKGVSKEWVQLSKGIGEFFVLLNSMKYTFIVGKIIFVVFVTIAHVMHIVYKIPVKGRNHSHAHKDTQDIIEKLVGCIGMMTTIVKNNKRFYMQQPQQRHRHKTRRHTVSKQPYRVHGGRYNACKEKSNKAPR